MMKVNGSSKTNGKKNEQKISRRNFLKGTGATVAGLVWATTSCAPRPDEQLNGTTISRVPQPIQYPQVPFTPPQRPAEQMLRFFTPPEAQTVEAFCARLLPGTPEDPGAREAGVVFYIDTVMADQEGFAQGIYREPPFAEPYEGDAPPEEENSYNIIWIPADQIERYGYQSVLTPREVMRLGISALDRYTHQQYGENFRDLGEEQQDEVIQAMIDETLEGFTPISSLTFFHVMRRWTMEGMFSDPVYGGNANLAGWRLVGYPGAQRAYTIEELHTEGSGMRRTVWSIETMPHFNPGENVGPHPVNPVRGSEDYEQ